MKAFIDVDDREEADLIRLGLNSKTVRALVKIIATLSLLPSDRARARVVKLVGDKLDEDANAAR